MKSINKKIKSIYLLAIMAIISVCLAVFPVFKTETVKAEDAELSMTGAYVEFSKANDANDFALMFQAEITKTFVDSKAGQNVKFGMAIGPATNLSSVSSYTDFEALGNKVVVLNDLVDINEISFDDKETTFAYEAGTYFNKNEAGYDKFTAAQWKGAYKKDLTAIPFYTVEGEAPVLKASITRNASQVVFDTFLAETTLPANSELRTVSDAAFTAITGRSLRNSYGNDEVIYLNMDTNQFFANFMRNGYTYTNLKQLQRWWPGMAYTSSNWQLGTNKNNPTYFAGGELKTAYTADTGSLTTSNFTNLDGIQKLTPGGKYRAYYIPGNSESEMVYFTYTAASQVFGINAPKGKGTMGSFTQLGITDKEGEDPVIKWFFAYGVSSSNIYMPYTRTSAKTAYNKNAYDGYYVLMSDWVFEGVDGMSIVYQGSSGGAQATVATTGAQTPAAASFGALKNLPNYFSKFNTSVKQAAFTGTFDGAGHTIDASFTRGGLFGYIDGGTIKNVNIKADFYTYAATSDKAAGYANTSYMEKAAVLAEVIENATIENVAIELVENAPTTFEYKQDYLSEVEGEGVLTYDNIPEMDNVPGIIASQGIYNSTLNNVIVRCDSLKDAGNSLQNFRAALNLQGYENKLNNVFVIGSSYTNMSIEETADAYVLTLSAPEGVEPGEYVNDGTIPASYFEMAEDMFKYMRNVDVSAKTIKVKFIAEKATKKFATEEAFQTYINSEAGAEAKAALIGSEMWYEVDGNLVWVGFIAYSVQTGLVEAYGSEPVLTTSSAKKVGGYYSMKGSHTLGAKPTLDTSDLYQWGITYNPRVTVAG